MFRCSLFIRVLLLNVNVLLPAWQNIFLLFSQIVPPFLPWHLLSSLSLVLPLLPLFFSFSYFLTIKQTDRPERPVQSGVLVLITCPWRTVPGRKLCSCRVNLDLQLSGSRAQPSGRSLLRALTLLLLLPLLLQNHPPTRLLLLLLHPPGWCSSWQHRWAPARQRRRKGVGLKN